MSYNSLWAESWNDPIVEISSFLFFFFYLFFSLPIVQTFHIFCLFFCLFMAEGKSLAVTPLQAEMGGQSGQQKAAGAGGPLCTPQVPEPDVLGHQRKSWSRDSRPGDPGQSLF